MSLIPECSTLIFDIGDVLFSWCPVNTTSIAPRTVKSILRSPIWHEYECGRLSEDECYRLVAEAFSLETSEVHRAVADVRKSLAPDNAFLGFIQQLQAEAGGRLRIFAMSNISAPDYAFLRKLPVDWDIFQRVFTSAGAGMRKPNLIFYRHVLDEVKADPSSVVFVDDRLENVIAARSLGINGIVFNDPASVRQTLRCYVGNSMLRGRAYLTARAGRLESETTSGEEIEENLNQLLILEATGDKTLVRFNHYPHTWNFFRGEPQFTTANHPADLHTTAFGLMVTQPEDSIFDAVIEEMLEHLDSERIPQVYFDKTRPRIDPVVCVNVLSLFYSRGRGPELPEALDWIEGILQHRAYLEGTVYCKTPESFLFFASRLLRASADATLHARLAPLLKARLQERIGAGGHALALAMRINACATLGVRDEVDLQRLLMLQMEDGGWEASGIFNYPTSGIRFGNRGLTTAYALNAISALDVVRAPRL
ncbi:HAD-like protein [Artomyces pyxidatus]|uniref:HAD-like protein n=1 Tax=Artomyces pyxidatus TaxID=48021 RepID=A0ACB8TBG4_9AGAM|nr:HAD-like protein [Artomyces pyxidatus]